MVCLAIKNTWLETSKRYKEHSLIIKYEHYNTSFITQRTNAS
jgi:hypothetical protein